MREHPEIRLSHHSVFSASYDFDSNEIHFHDMETNFEEGRFFERALIHELTHWATFAMLTEQEKNTVAEYFAQSVLEYGVLGYSVILIERIAQEVSEDVE